jgi:hypothetical protein
MDHAHNRNRKQHGGHADGQGDGGLRAVRDGHGHRVDEQQTIKQRHLSLQVRRLGNSQIWVRSDLGKPSDQARKPQAPSPFHAIPLPLIPMAHEL